MVPALALGPKVSHSHRGFRPVKTPVRIESQVYDSMRYGQLLTTV